MTTRLWIVAVLAGLCVVSSARAQDYILEQPLAGPGVTPSSFGLRVTVDGATAVVADSLATAGGVVNAGSVDVYVKQGGAWGLQQRLAAAGGQNRDFFGSAVSLDGDTLAVGASADISGRPGKVYVYVRSGGTWSQQAVLAVGAGATQDLFGAAVSLSGNALIVNAPGGGNAYVYERAGTAWTQAAILPVSPGSRVFDQNVAISNTTACVGAPGTNQFGNPTAGLAKVYVRGPSSWSTQQTISAPSASALDFGGTCALDGDTLVVGAAGVASASGPFVGAAYVYVRSGTSWTLQQTLQASDASQRRFFSNSLAVLGNEIVAGASGSPGSAYVFQRVGAAWTERQRLLDTVPNRGFGESVGLDAATLVVGSFSSGGRAAAIFSRTATPPQPTPGAPANLQATVNGTTVNLSWSAPTSGGTPTSYTLLARTASGGPILGTLPLGNVTSFVAAAPNGVFVLSITATNLSGTGPESTASTVTVPSLPAPPGAPVNLAVSVAGSSATFTWNPPTSGGVVGNYLLVAGLTPGFAVPLGTLPLPAGSTTTAISGIPPGTYYVRLQAQNSGGTSAATNEVSLTVAGPAAPGAPTLNAPSVTGSTVGLSWTPGGGGAPTSYVLTALTAGGVVLGNVPLSGASASFPGVPSGSYLLRLVAVNSVGPSPPSNTVTLVVP